MNARVLVVDDEPAVGRALVRLLARAGIEATAETDALAALYRMEQEAFGAVISDERMPAIRGVEFLETCAREHPSVVRILLTGFADAETAAEAINRGEIFRLLWKPWDDEAVVGIVREALLRNALSTEPPEPGPEQAFEADGGGIVPPLPDD